jgi:hypothetical protein
MKSFPKGEPLSICLSYHKSTYDIIYPNQSYVLVTITLWGCVNIARKPIRPMKSR